MYSHNLLRYSARLLAALAFAGAAHAQTTTVAQTVSANPFGAVSSSKASASTKSVPCTFLTTATAQPTELGVGDVTTITYTVQPTAVSPACNNVLLRVKSNFTQVEGVSWTCSKNKNGPCLSGASGGGFGIAGAVAFSLGNFPDTTTKATAVVRFKAISQLPSTGNGVFVLADVQQVMNGGTV